MVNQAPGRIHFFSLQLLVLLLHHQWQVSFSAGLRGGDVISVGGGDVWLPVPSELGLPEEDDILSLPPLECPLDGPYTNSPCSGSSSAANRTTPVCEYNSQTQDYKTLCLKNQWSPHHVRLPQAHPKSYCGPCRACFQSQEELKAAVRKYQSYKQVHVELATQYGWPIGAWCVDRVTSFSNLFFQKSKFNEDLGRWQTRQVTDMTSMFQNAYAFNQPLSQWDTSNVQSMTRMFAMALHFDQDIGPWNVTNVQEMGYMFLHALEFDQDLSSWQVQNAHNLHSMFFGATRFRHEAILQHWQISEHADTDNMCEWAETEDADQQEASSSS